MTLETWVNLAIAIFPGVLIWIFKSGKSDQKTSGLAEDMAEFRAENKGQAKELKEEIRAGQKDVLERLEELESRHSEHLNDLEIRTARLEEFRHATNNRLTILAGHVDELRIRKS